ncbi:MAG: carbohydrate ABC transporter substrate-binding protein [Oscillospiraceae bacterium]|nr:carbohydrate ABC transporter substrate-binding protein [Oscillospiraceae bacterium]
MSKLTRTLALVATLAMASSALVACGGNTESSTAPAASTAESTAESAAESVEESAAESSEAPAPASDLTNDDATLTVVCWTDADLANMFDVYKDQGLLSDGVTLNYQNCGGNGGEAATQYATYLNSGDDVDLFVAEAGWILNYINDDSFSAPLSDLGITEADYGDAYKYTVEIGTDNNGVLKAASWQAAAGGYAYNADLAKEYLGVEDTDAMQAKVADWSKFEATAKELKDASNGEVKIAATIGGLWQAFSTAKNAPWVEGTTIKTDVAKEFTDMVKGYVDNGYVDPSIEQWTADWTNAGLNGKALGYFYSTWCLGEGAQLEQNGGNAGNWRIINGPQTFFWGGSWLCLSPNCNTKLEAQKFTKAFTADKATMKAYALYSGDFANNKAAMDEIVAEGSNSNALLGGQDQFAVLSDVAANIKMSDSISKYDQSLKDTFLTALKDNIKEDSDTIIDKFTTDALAANPDLSK